MTDVAKKMDFDVYTDLKSKTQQYNVKIDLEEEVNSQTRELVIALVGATVRNNYKGIYGDILEDNELVKVIERNLETWIPKETNFKVASININKRVETKLARAS